MRQRAHRQAPEEGHAVRCGHEAPMPELWWKMPRGCRGWGDTASKD